MKKEDILKLGRRNVRYQLYRIRTEAEGGASHKAKQIKLYYEKQPGFTRWVGFAREWDVDSEGKHHLIVRRRNSEEQEWNYKLSGLAVELPWSRK